MAGVGVGGACSQDSEGRSVSSEPAPWAPAVTGGWTHAGHVTDQQRPQVRKDKRPLKRAQLRFSAGKAARPGEAV